MAIPTKLVNLLLLTAKFYIHQQKLFHSGEISLIAYLMEVKNKLVTEKMACSREGRPNKFKVREILFNVLSP